jgi:hypothetical protein
LVRSDTVTSRLSRSISVTHWPFWRIIPPLIEMDCCPLETSAVLGKLIFEYIQELTGGSAVTSTSTAQAEMKTPVDYLPRKLPDTEGSFLSNRQKIKETP